MVLGLFPNSVIWCLLLAEWFPVTDTVTGLSTYYGSQWLPASKAYVILQHNFILIIRNFAEDQELPRFFIPIEHVPTACDPCSIAHPSLPVVRIFHAICVPPINSTLSTPLTFL